jgi:hypothetical protein
VVLAVTVGLALALFLGWLVLSGLLAATFRRARAIVRRAIERRRQPRESPDRRHAERRGP